MMSFLHQLACIGTHKTHRINRGPRDSPPKRKKPVDCNWYVQQIYLSLPATFLRMSHQQWGGRAFSEMRFNAYRLSWMLLHISFFQVGLSRGQRFLGNEDLCTTGHRPSQLRSVFQKAKQEETLWQCLDHPSESYPTFGWLPLSWRIGMPSHLGCDTRAPRYPS